jgi:hypothetical protein
MIRTWARAVSKPLPISRGIDCGKYQAQLLRLVYSDWHIPRFDGPADLPGLPANFLPEGSGVVEEFSAVSETPSRGLRGEPGALDFSYDLAAGDSALLALRHPSGALTFHLPVEFAWSRLD